MQQSIKNNEFGYLGNPNVKRDGVQTSFTKEEILEYQRCMQDPAYFAKAHVKIISLDEGLVPFNLYHIKKRCLIILKIIDFLLFWLVGKVVNKYRLLYISYGMHVFILKRQLQY